jgi:Ni/Co efflux regulator RcnB
MRLSIVLAFAAAAALAAAPAAWAEEPPHEEHNAAPHGQQHGAPQGQHGPQGQHQGPQGQHPGPGPQGQHGGAGPVAHGGPGPVGGPRGGHADPHWAQNRGGFRNTHAGWDSHAAWRGNRGWYRGRPEFRLFVGVRPGFWFVPGIGYYHVPPQYYGHHWGYGEFLPNFFWQYQVADWGAYGLYPPPLGCAWVWVDGGVVLVDMSDGYIMDTEYGMW